MTRAPWPLSDWAAALADVAVAADDRDLAAEHDVGGAHQAVDERVPAAVEVVELALGDAVVDVDGGEEKRAGLLHLVEAMHAGGGLLADALAVLGDLGPAVGGFFHGLGQELEDDRPFFVVVVGGDGDLAGLFVFDALVDQEGGVAAVVDDLVGPAAVAEVEGAFGTPPVFFEGFAFPGEDGDAAGIGGGAAGFRPADSQRGGGMVLGAEDVAGAPAHVGAEGRQRLDEDGGLDGHVQAAHDPQTLERLLGGVFVADRHQAGHFLLGQHDFLAAPLGQRQVGDFEFKRSSARHCARRGGFNRQCHFEVLVNGLIATSKCSTVYLVTQLLNVLVRHSQEQASALSPAAPAAAC